MPRTMTDKVRIANARYQRDHGPHYKSLGRYMTKEEYEAYRKKLQEIFRRPAYAVRGKA